MAKEVAIGKRAIISKSQQYTLLAVLGASVVVGATFSFVFHFIDQIGFNSKVIVEEDKSIASYSNAIRDIGVCPKPKGSVYTDSELKSCNPATVSVSSIAGSLRANVLNNMANNSALSSVPNEKTSGCVNWVTGKNYTYSELEELYNDALEKNDTEDAITASNLMRSCSALRIIPDALPADFNEYALMSSLNKIFILSDWEPESLNPSGSSTASSIGTNMYEMSLRLAVEADTATTVKFLDNVERSIREFNILRATVSWGDDDTLLLEAQASAYYMQPSKLKEKDQTIKIKEGAN